VNDSRKVVDGFARWGFAVVFLPLAVYHGFLRHDWMHAASDVCSIFFAAFIYWFGSYVWNKFLRSIFAKPRN
jgi:hypothetical protein